MFISTQEVVFMKNGQSIQMNFSLTERERRIIKKVSVDKGLFNYSAAIRLIISEWAELTNNQPPLDGEDNDQSIAGLA